MRTYNKNYENGRYFRCTNLTVRISAPMPEVIRVQVYHYKGVQKKKPEYELNIPSELKLDVKEEN